MLIQILATGAERTDFPESREGFSGTGSDHAVMIHAVVQRVGVKWWLVVKNWHRRVVREVGLEQHFEHTVPSDLEERSSCSTDIFQLDPAVL